MKSAAQRTTLFANLSCSVTAWKLTWSQAVVIGDTWVLLAVASEGAAGAEKRVLFSLKESFDAFLLDILVSLSLSISLDQTEAYMRSLARVDFGTEGGGADVD